MRCVPRFLLITTRPEDLIAQAEYESFLRFTGLRAQELDWVRLEQDDPPQIDAEEYDGIILGGSPFNTTDLPDQKSAVQRRVETDLSALLDVVVGKDLPFFGACYGVGTLGVHQGAIVDRTHGELVGIVPVTLTEAGREDPVLREAGLPDPFRAIVGHKEAVSALPEHAVLLATGEGAPVQMFRIGSCQYATQFHPEMDIDLLIERLTAYQSHGYFEPGTFEATVQRLRSTAMDETDRLLRAFVTVHGT